MSGAHVRASDSHRPLNYRTEPPGLAHRKRCQGYADSGHRARNRSLAAGSFITAARARGTISPCPDETRNFRRPWIWRGEETGRAHTGSCRLAVTTRSRTGFTRSCIAWRATCRMHATGISDAGVSSKKSCRSHRSSRRSGRPFRAGADDRRPTRARSRSALRASTVGLILSRQRKAFHCFRPGSHATITPQFDGRLIRRS